LSYNVQAADQVFESITGKIKRLEWAPGTRIETEAELCEGLGVSRVAVRQAIEKLSALKVLRKVQGSGTYVESIEKASLPGLQYYPLSRETTIMVLEFRRMFDSYNTELFTQKCTEGDIARVEANYQNMKESEHDRLLFHHYDQEFHDILAYGTKNPIIIQIADVLRELLSEQQYVLFPNVGPEHAIYYHSIILKCLKDRNGDLGARYARLHIDNSLQHLISQEGDKNLPFPYI
jgi:DNA-binding FadR family transcriptional regulator